jgi:hypothetical protein
VTAPFNLALRGIRDDDESVRGVRERNRLERHFLRLLQAYFNTELRLVLRDAKRGIVHTTNRKRLEALMTQMLRQGALLGVQDAVAPIARLGMSFDTTLVNEAALAWVRTYGNTAYDGAGVAGAIDNHSRSVIQREVSEYFANARTVEELRDALTPTFGRRRASLIANTEITNALSGSNLATWEEINRQVGTELVVGSRWTTANDERVCPICSPLGGLIYSESGAQPQDINEQRRQGVVAPLGSSFSHPGGGGLAERFKDRVYERPPAHPGCRCTLAPVVVR